MSRSPDKKKKYLLFPLLLLFAMLCLQFTGEAAAIRSTPGFSVGGTPFHFIGGFLPGWHWGDASWSETVDHDLITSARNTGITVMHIMLPLFEGPLGVYDEAKLQRLDHFLDSAYNANVYVMPSFIQAYGEITLDSSNPYYHERGIEGIIKDPTLLGGLTLREHFKNRIAALVNRTNTINGRPYKNDPVIMAWIICDEPISAPFNYPKGVPQVTLDELKDWFKETSSFIKSTDANHLVTVWSQPAIQEFFGGTSDYLQALGISEFDFLYTEDADLSIVPGLTQLCPPSSPDYMLEQFLPGKPVVFHPAFTSGCWDRNVICDADFTVQAADLNLAIPKYFEVGANGVFIQNWGTDLYSFVPDFAVCFNYTDSYPKIVDVARTQSTLINPNANPVSPLGFVSVIYGPNSPELSPKEGTSGTQITITGSDFGMKKGKVLIGGVATKILKDGWKLDSIICTVNKVPSAGTHNVTIEPYRADDITLSNAFIVKPPEISSLDFYHGVVGAPITITGKFFSTKKGKVYLEYEKDGQPKMKRCKVTSWGMDRITFIVPKGLVSGIAYPLKVTNKVDIATAPSDFIID